MANDLSKQSKKKNKPIHPIIPDLTQFFGELIKRWFFWVTLISGIIGITVQYFYPNLRIPQYIFISLALFGFIWSAFEVYRNLALTYRKLMPNVMNPYSELKISLVEGNEYSYEIGNPYETLEAQNCLMKMKLEKKEFHYDATGVLYIEDRPYYSLPPIYLTLNVRFENVGNVPIDVLANNISYSKDNFKPFNVYNNKIQIDNKDIVYPLHLDPKIIFLLNMSYSIQPEETLSTTNAVLAVAISQLAPQFSIKLKVDTLDDIGNRKIYSLDKDVSSRPLVDSFVSQWQGYNQTELLRLIKIPIRKNVPQ